MLDIMTECKLSKADVVAFRKAKDVCFRVRDGRASVELRAEIKANADDAFQYKVDAEREVAAKFVIQDYHRDDGTHTTGPEYKCFSFINSAQFHEGYCTFASLLKEEDELRLKWVRGGSTSREMRARGYDSMELHVVVDRCTGGKWRRLSFLLDHEFHEPGNKVLRMIEKV